MYKNQYGWLGYACAIVTCVLYLTQYFFNWFGVSRFEKGFFSILVVIICLFGFGFTLTGIKENKGKLEGLAIFSILKIVVLGFSIFIVILIAGNSVAFSMNMDFFSYAVEDLGVLRGIPQLTHISSGDMMDLQLFGIGVASIIRALFLVIPALLATWCAISLMTADELSDGKTAIFCLIGAFFVFIIAWVFNAMGVSLFP